MSYRDVGGWGCFGGASSGECKPLSRLPNRKWIDQVILALWVSENATCTYFSKGTSVPKLETLLNSIRELMYINVHFVSPQWLQSRTVVSRNQGPLCRTACVLRLSYIIVYQRKHGDWVRSTSVVVLHLALTCYVACPINLFGSYVLGL